MKSAVMLLGRLLMASLFVFVGYTQVLCSRHFFLKTEPDPCLATRSECCTVPSDTVRPTHPLPDTDDRMISASCARFVLPPTRCLALVQIHRVISRDWKLWHSSVASAWRRDGHDNNWLLLEFALSLPFAVGLQTEAVSRALAATMVAEVRCSRVAWSCLSAVVVRKSRMSWRLRDPISNTDPGREITAGSSCRACQWQV